MLGIFALIGSSAGQAWVPEKGTGSLTSAYSYIDSTGHLSSDGTQVQEAAAKSQSILVEVDYGLTDKLAITASVPIVMARYADTNPPSSVLRGLFEQTKQAVGPQFYQHGFLDDQSYHPTLQDFNVSLRYQLRARPFAFTPFLAIGIPSHDYAYVGEAAPGRNLREFQFGANAASRLKGSLRRAYLEGQFAFAIPEKSLNVRTDRLNLSLEFGYLLTRKFAVRGIGMYQHTLAGLHFPRDLTTPEIALTHERLLQANYWHVGGGVSYDFTGKNTLSIDYVNFLAGSDTHYGNALNVAITRSFSLKMPWTKTR